MEERYISHFIQSLVERFEYLGENGFDLTKELEFLVHPVTRTPLVTEDLRRIETGFLERIQYRRSHDGAVLVPVSVVSDPREHEEWFEAWFNENNNNVGSYYWKRLEEFLSRALTRKYGPHKAGRVVRSIDEATHSIIARLANPVRREFSYKGLVVGYVQSGKTANFTALIAKAADAGYRLIIVLSGIHSVLRRQTQIRLDKELTGMNDLAIQELFIDEPSDIKRWNRITTSRLRTRRSRDGQLRIRDLGEFDTVNVDPFDSLCNRATPTLAIIKKNVRVLNKLIEYISQSTEENRRNIPLLIIDDEADQASIDGNANDPDSDPTGTNDRIRRILSLFPRKAYVGYTATPFANVLIDMASEHQELEDDLYPRNFIVSLPKPENYFGTTLLFQSDLSQRFIVEIPREIGDDVYDEARSLIREGRITEYLSRAIDQFILGCCVRNTRGQTMLPMSMLIHVSHRISDMAVIHSLVNNYVAGIIGRYRHGTHSEALREQFEAEWLDFIEDSEAINQELELSNEIPEFEVVWNQVEAVFRILRVMVLNSSSEDTLDYTTGEEIKVIAIGGNQLSRGLTLEGLMISYYLRANRAIAYDTLLQMGRWFGYRQGYEDLTRVHTTDQIWDYFEHLALVEEELRSEIYRYEEEGLTPLQMAVAIRAHQNLTITAPNKMGAANLRQTSYSNSLSQTIWLPLDNAAILTANYRLGESFIRRLNDDVGFGVNNGIFIANQRIPANRVMREFLTRYRFVDRESTGGPGLDSEKLLAYIDRRITYSAPELQEWSIGVVSNINPTASDDPLDYGGLPINRIQRSRKHTERGYNIGVLTEPYHLNADLTNEQPRSSQNPFLLLYLIWKDSRALRQRTNPSFDERIDLFRFINSDRVDVLGIAIVLPKSDYEPNSYIGQ